MWDASTGTAVCPPFQTYPSPCTVPIAFAPDNTVIMSVSSDDATDTPQLNLWDLSPYLTPSQGAAQDSTVGHVTDSIPISAFNRAPGERVDGLQGMARPHWLQSFSRMDKSNGWVKAPDGRTLLLWVPPRFRDWMPDPRLLKTIKLGGEEGVEIMRYTADFDMLTRFSRTNWTGIYTK